MKLNTSQKHDFMKCIEELSELSVELLHAVNKPKKRNHLKILNEITDVEFYLKKVKEVLDNSGKII